MCEQYHLAWDSETGEVEVFAPGAKTPVEDSSPMALAGTVTEDEARKAAEVRGATFEVIG